MRARASLLMLALATFGCSLARADDSRPDTPDTHDEGSMFDAAPAPAMAVAPKSAPAKPQAKAEADSDAAELGHADVKRDAFASGEVVDNPLTIGGVFYDRFIVSPQNGIDAKNISISSPLQFDGYLDARPSDRIRGFVDARLLYDPTRNSYSQTTAGQSFSSLQVNSTSTSSLSTSTSSYPNNPQVVLDQAWLKFDIARFVYVTAGNQHVKWGASHYWNPTDYLNPSHLDPLMPYDLRLGNPMVKLEVPWEKAQMNFYAITLFNNPIAASTFGQVGEALRVEKVFGSTEIGLDTVFRGNKEPVYGADISAPLGPFDVYAEASLLPVLSTPTYQAINPLSSGGELSTNYTTVASTGPYVQASGGLNYSFAWKDNREATLGAEYFFNQPGYSDYNVYPILMFTGVFQGFYTGKHYAAIYLSAEGPDSEKHTNFNFSTVANLSDLSFISRIDFTWRFLTYLTFEAYVDAHYGTVGGEFNFSLPSGLTYQGTALPSVASTLMDAGLGLRVSF